MQDVRTMREGQVFLLNGNSNEIKIKKRVGFVDAKTEKYTKFSRGKVGERINDKVAAQNLGMHYNNNFVEYKEKLLAKDFKK